MDHEDLEELLSQLRRFRMDHQHVEAKRARSQLPEDLWSTISAFANADGGIILLGVDEKSDFSVQGVENPADVAAALQSLASEMAPPLRLLIDLVDHPNGVVIAGQVSQVPRVQRPCHYRPKGVFDGSFIRVGDGDQPMSRGEVAELLAARQGEDHSTRLAPEGAKLDEDLVTQLRDSASSRPRYADADSRKVLEHWRAVDNDGKPTLAGVLSLGLNPEGLLLAARVNYRVLPSAQAPAGTRYSKHLIEGTVGEILDAAMAQLRKDLKTFQIEQAGALVDDMEVPAEALREIIANALVHRSLTDISESEPVTIEVSEAAVSIISPGGLYQNVDPERLGLDPFAGVRNLALVRICERLETPSRARIVETQGSGIRAADEACRSRGTAPPLFVDHPARLEVILLRGRLPYEDAENLLRKVTIPVTAVHTRLVAWALRLEKLRDEFDAAQRHAAALDMALAARLCTWVSPEEAAAALVELMRAGVLRRVGPVTHRSWRISTDKSADVRVEPAGGDRIPELLRALVARDGQASAQELADDLGFATTGGVMRWVRRAIKKKLVSPTTERPNNPGREYRITQTGEAVARRSEK